SRTLCRRLGATALHYRLRHAGLDRLSRRAAVDGLDLSGDRASDVAVGRGIPDRPRAPGHRLHLATALVLPFLRRQYDRTDLRAGLRHRASVASPRMDQVWNDRGFIDDPGAARRFLYGRVVGSLGVVWSAVFRRKGFAKQARPPEGGTPN